MKKSISTSSKTTKKKPNKFLAFFRNSKVALPVLLAVVFAAIGTYTITKSSALTAINPATNLTVSVTSPTATQLYWWPSTSVPSPGYNVFRDNVKIAYIGYWLSFDGRVSYADSNLTPGTSYTYYIQATNDQGTADSNPVTVTTSQSPTAAQVGTITGTVTGSRKVPVANAKVGLIYYNQVTSVNTDANGNFSIPNIPAGSYPVSVAALGYKTASPRVNVVGGQSVNLQVSLKVAR